MFNMETTKLSSKGQVVLPKSVRDAHGWGPGTEFVIESTPDGIRLRAKAPFALTHLGQAFGSARYACPVKSLDDMDAGVRFNVAPRHRPAPQLQCRDQVRRVRREPAFCGPIQGLDSRTHSDPGE